MSLKLLIIFISFQEKPFLCLCTSSCVRAQTSFQEILNQLAAMSISVIVFKMVCPQSSTQIYVLIMTAFKVYESASFWFQMQLSMSTNQCVFDYNILFFIFNKKPQKNLLYLLKHKWMMVKKIGRYEYQLEFLQCWINQRRFVLNLKIK